MNGFKVANLKMMVEEVGEDRVKAILSNFACPLNPDVEGFLHNNAIEFAKQGIAATHLVFASYRDEPVLVGYFTLANKHIIIKDSLKISSTLRRRMSKFGTHEPELNRRTISAPLIAQLGKNYASGYNTLITGDELLKMACDKIVEIHSIMGGRIAYLECENKPKLIDFYTSNGFQVFSSRPLDGDEQRTMEGHELVQMIRLFRSVPSTVSPQD